VRRAHIPVPATKRGSCYVCARYCVMTLARGTTLTSPSTHGPDPVGSASPSPAQWKAILAPYQRPDSWRSVIQLLNTAVPFAALWAVMAILVDRAYWVTLLLSLPAAMLLVRMFIFQHDCGHGSFFKSRRANNVIGGIIGVMTLVPYGYWRKTHAVHHAGSGNLDMRTFGDIDTLTVREYLKLSPSKRRHYRLYRHPLVMLGIGPLFQFVFKHRWPADLPRSWQREWASIHRTNLALLAVLLIAAFTIGLERFFLVQAPITILAGTIGVFLFYVQHQYEDTYWRYRDRWDYFEAALYGSSHLVLPTPLQWCTANIGLHHVHHMNSRIPNHQLQKCFDDNPELHRVTQLSLWQSVSTLRLTLWDEDSAQLIGFRELEARRDAVSDSPVVDPPKQEAIPKSWR